MERRQLKLGTRGSALAMWQANHVAAMIRAQGWDCEICIISTTGDEYQGVQRHAQLEQLDAGRKGMFVKRIEDALLKGEIDAAIHSLKDMPAIQPEGLVLAAVPERTTPRDGLVTLEGAPWTDWPEGAVVATSSVRREAQLRNLRPDLRVVSIRGNVGTRADKLKTGELEATVLAMAGVTRLEMTGQMNIQPMEPEQMTPAMGQGALAIEAREGEFMELWQALEDSQARKAVDLERAVVGRLGGGCNTPMGVLAEPWREGHWRVTLMLASEDARQLIREQHVFNDDATLEQTVVDWSLEVAKKAAPEIQQTLYVFQAKSNGDKTPAPARRILSTRPAETSAAFNRELKARGVEAIGFPVIRFESVEHDEEAFATELARLRAKRGWLVLPSRAAIDYAVEAGRYDGVAIACIGSGSASHMRGYGLPAGFMPPEANGASLAATLPGAPGTPVLIAGAEDSRPELREGLEARGFDVRHWALYRTVADTKQAQRLIERLRNAEHGREPVLVASPSAADAILEAMEANLKQGGRTAQQILDREWFVTGQTTHRHLRERLGNGVEIIELESPTAAHLAEALEAIAPPR